MTKDLMINWLTTQPQEMLHVEKLKEFISCEKILSIMKNILQQILAKEMSLEI